MEKLWRFRSRKKSKGQSDANGFTTFADAESSYSRTGSSSIKASTERPSIALSRPSDVPAEKLHNDRFHQSKSPPDWKRPGSSNRMQPTFVGISRPFDEKRPGTAGSMQKALDQVAESVSQSPIGLPATPVSPMSGKGGKYVDVLAITTSPKSNARTYNEDVASRNPDYAAHDGQPPGEYKPASKYQEEVASRNAYQITAARASSLRREILVGHNRSDSLSTVGDGGSYQHRGRTSADHTRPRAPGDTVAYHSRQNGSRVRDNAESLPVIPQERSNEELSATQKRLELSQRTEYELERAREKWMDVRRQNRAEPRPDIDKPLPASPRVRDVQDGTASSITNSLQQAAAVPTASDRQISRDMEVTNMYSSDQSVSGSVPPYSEVVRTPPRQTIPISHRANTGRTHDSFRPLDRLPLPSEVSGTPYRRTFVGNRTIMDLTDEEEEQESSANVSRFGASSVASHRLNREEEPMPYASRYGASSSASYRQAISVASYQQTPTLEHARADAFSLGLPLIVDHSPQKQIPPQALSVASYQQTPILEDARADAFSKVSPVMVDHSPVNSFPPQKYLAPQIRERDSAIPYARWSSAREPVLDLDQLKRQSQAISESTKMALRINGPLHERRQSITVPPPPASAHTAPGLAFSPIQTVTLAHPAKAITFSAVSTLSSISPRSSQESIVLPVPVAEAPVPPPKKQAPSTATDLSMQSRSAARISANIAPLVRIFADPHPEDAKSAPPQKPREERPGDRSRKTSSTSVSSKATGKRRERTAEEQAIRLAAKSIIPAGPLDKEPMPGVKTRDFAVTPAEKPAYKRVEALSERQLVAPESSKSVREKSPSKSSSSSGERKSRSKSSKSGGKVPATEAIPAATALSKSQDKDEKRKSSKKPSKTNSSTTRKVKSLPKYNDEAYKKKHAEANAALLKLQQSLQEGFVEDSRPGSVTPQGTETPAGRALSPDLAVNSHAVAALAMINAATSPGSRLQAQMKAARSVHSKTSSENVRMPQAFKPDFMPRSVTDTQVPTMRSTTLSANNPLLARIDFNSKPPPSPGEVSLSAFPIPTPRAMSPESAHGPPAYVKDVGMPVRRGSQSSRMSAASAFSIPFTMVPSRLGSLPENRVGIPGPATNIPMNSIASVTSQIS